MVWSLTGRLRVTRRRRRLGFLPQEMENAWNEYGRLEGDVDWLRSALQAHMNRGDLTQVGVPATPTEMHDE